jgi:hypothetical protein
MRTENRLAGWAGIVVVVAGSGAFLYSCVGARSYELATASAAFTAAGLYLLFGREPPTNSTL